jgi:hypothetical protein
LKDDSVKNSSIKNGNAAAESCCGAKTQKNNPAGCCTDSSTTEKQSSGDGCRCAIKSAKKTSFADLTPAVSLNRLTDELKTQLHSLAVFAASSASAVVILFCPQTFDISGFPLPVRLHLLLQVLLN